MPDDPQSTAASIARFIDDPEYRRRVGEHDFVAASGLPISEVVDWYLLHFERLLKQCRTAALTVSQEAN